MICRKCSAVIDDASEKCPVCKRAPGKNQNDKPKAASTLVFAAVLVFAATALFAVLHHYVDLQTFSLRKSTFSQPTEEASTEAAFHAVTTVGKSQAQSDTGEDFLLGAKVFITDMYLPNGTKIASKAVVEVDKQRMLGASQEQFKAFCLAKIYNRNYAYFTIDLLDGTGIVFSSGAIGSAVYARLDGGKTTQTALAQIILSEDGEYVCILNETESQTESEQTSVDESAADTSGDTDETSRTQQTSASQGEQSESKTVFKADEIINVPEAETTIVHTAASTRVNTTAEEAKSEAGTKATEGSTIKSTAEKSTAEKTTHKTTVTSTAHTDAAAPLEDLGEVYITKTGKKFHRSGCSSLSKSCTSISPQDAINEGYEPCKRCFGAD